MGTVTSGGEPAAKTIWRAALPAAALGLLAAVSAAVSAGPPPARAAEILAQAAQQRSFDIPTQPLPSALPLFGQQAGIQISADGNLVRDLRTAGVSGTMTVETALRQLLAGTGLVYRFAADNTVTLARAATQEDEGPMRLGPVIVTGERVEASIIDTESSVTVLDEEDLERADAATVYDALRSAPNLVPVPPDFLPPIRGANSDGPLGIAGNDLNGTTPRASLIVDGVSRPISYANNAFNALFDVEQVEVFRGPQTTVRGANAISGSFVINTKNPVFDRQATIQGNLEYDEIGDVGYRTGVMYNDVLIEDQLASRFVLEYEEGEIPIDYLEAGENEPNDSLSEFDRIAGRAKLLLEPEAFPDFAGLLQLEYQEGRDPAFDSSVTGTSLGGDPEKRVNRFAQRVFDTRAFGGKLDLSYFFGPDELKSTTSYFRDSYSDNPDSTEAFVGFDNIVDERFVQDLTYAFEDVGGFASGIVGVTLQRQDKTAEYGLGFDFDTFGERETAASFADTTLDLGKGFELIAGGRIQYERNEFETTINTFGNSAEVDYNETDIVFLPKFGLSYALSDNQKVFATYRRGFNSGGAGVNFFTGVPFVFDPEFVHTAEAGYRGSFDSGDIIVAATAFYNQYDGYHAYVFGPGGPTDYTIRNVDGETYGAELEVNARLNAFLQTRFGLGLLQTELDAPGETYDGNGFGDDPEVTFNAGFAWEALPGLSVDAQAIYVSEYFSDFNEDAGTEAGDYWNLDLGVSYQQESFLVRGYVRNALDDLQYATRGADDGGNVLAPRTFGVTAKVTF